MTVDPGFTFFNYGHLWVVVAELPGAREELVVVSLTTKRDGSDTTTLLLPGDHPFIQHETVVYYADVRRFDKTDFVGRVESKFFGIGEPFPPAVLGRIQRGLMASPFTPRSFKKLCEGLF